MHEMGIPVPKLVSMISFFLVDWLDYNQGMVSYLSWASFCGGAGGGIHLG